MASCESTGGQLSFEWSHHRISSIDSKVTVTLHNPIKHSGSERVNMDQPRSQGSLLPDQRNERKREYPLSVAKSEGETDAFAGYFVYLPLKNGSPLTYLLSKNKSLKQGSILLVIFM